MRNAEHETGMVVPMATPCVVCGLIAGGDVGMVRPVPIGPNDVPLGFVWANCRRAIVAPKACPGCNRMGGDVYFAN